MLSRVTSLSAIAAAVVVTTTAIAAPAEALQLTVTDSDQKERRFEVDWVEGSFFANQQELESNPWWGDLDLATALAKEMQANWNSGSNFSGLPGISFYGFLFGTGINPSFSVIVEGTLNYGGDDVYVGDFLASANTNWGVQNTNFRWATAEEIPTPALLPGLIGMGIAAIRKRNAEEAEADA